MQIIIFTLALLRFAVLALGFEIWSWAGHDTVIVNRMPSGKCLSELTSIGNTWIGKGGETQLKSSGKFAELASLPTETQDCLIHATLIFSDKSGKAIPAISAVQQAVVGNMIVGYSEALSRGVATNPDQFATICEDIWNIPTRMYVKLYDNGLTLALCIADKS